ncbi:hypothetical protein [Paraburkholderia sp. BL25I1N1]|uniref:hypothetical protein n=1 Tax=Paraburkholderia sp. BL25I1N1 TaxID=1938804 RepID=UPI000D080889|nr:hypothetical protein [Paraburkholderia sp. BL25I1N1]PRY08730.1 hypothetical protein B0G73_102306 [Paraburkholderia sp. BL25I1N1]
MKKQHVLSAVFIVTSVVGSVIGGWYLACLFGLLPLEMPRCVDLFIRLALSVTGNDELANPDDMEILALLLYWAVATLLIAVTLFGYKRWLVRYRTAKKNDEAIPKLPLLVKFDVCLLALLVSADLGWWLLSLFLTYPYKIPGAVRAAFGFCQSVRGKWGGADRCDDLGFFALNLYWAIATLCVGALLILCCISASRILLRKMS